MAKQKETTIDDLTFDAANARKHPEKNKKAIADSMKQFKAGRSILIDADNIIRAGNGTAEAWKESGGKVRVIESDGTELIAVKRTDLKGAEAMAYAIADNRAGELAKWDDEILGSQLEVLRQDGFDLSELSFEEADLNGLIEEDQIKDIEPMSASDELKEKWGTADGQLWIIEGKQTHRLLCGDSTKADDVGRLMGGENAQLWLTDPPYNVAYEGGSKVRDAIANDKMGDEQFREWIASAFKVAFDAIDQGATFYIWHADTEGYNFRGAIRDCGEQIRQCLVWNKNNSMFSRQDYHWKHEPCLYGWKAGAAHSWHTDRRQTTVLEFDRPSRSDEHPTMKPVDLVAYQIGNSSKPKQTVLDTFLGSGTTMLASEQLKRKCYGMEISPKYCAVILQRMTDAGCNCSLSKE